MADHSFMSQVEVLSVTDTGRRRRWTDAEKLRIVEESYAAPRVDASRAGHDVEAQPRRQGDRLHVQEGSLGGVHALPRRWTDLPDEQRGRTGAARHRPWQDHGSSPAPSAAATVPPSCIP